MSEQDVKKKPKKEKELKEKETKKAKQEETSSLFDKQNVQRNNVVDIESSAEQTNKTLKRKQNGAHKANVKKKSIASDSDSEDSEDYGKSIKESDVKEQAPLKEKRGAALKAQEKRDKKPSSQTISISDDDSSN